MAIKSGSSRTPKKGKPMQLVMGFIRKHGRTHGTSSKDVKGYLMNDHGMTESQAKKATELCLKRGVEFGLLARKRNLFSLQSCAMPLIDRGARSNCGRHGKKHKKPKAARGGRRSRRGHGRGNSSKGGGRRSRRGGGRGRRGFSDRGQGRRSLRGRKSHRGRKCKGSGQRGRDSTEPQPQMSMVKRLVNFCVSLGGKSKQVDHADLSSKPYQLAQKGTKRGLKGMNPSFE